MFPVTELNKIYRLRDDYLILTAIKKALSDNTSILCGIVADPFSIYFRGNGKTSYALHITAAFYRFIYHYSVSDAWMKAIDSIVFSIEDLKRAIDKSSRKNIIIADDLGRWFASKNAYNKEERHIFEILETFRLNAAALLWTAVTPRSVSSKIIQHSDYIVYVSRINEDASRAEVWRAVINKAKPYKEPKFIFVNEETFPIRYPYHDEYVKRRIERFKYNIEQNTESK